MLEARAHAQGSASDETAPGPGPCLLNFTVAIASGLTPLESVRHPIATVYSLYCNKGRLGFYCDLETWLWQGFW
jgi:hypothetical protein